MRAKEFIVDAISLDKIRAAGSPETQSNKDLASRLKQSMPSKPRNFVAKNATKGGAGAHKDKKRAEKQGDVKHKAKQYEEGVAEGAVITKDQLVDIYIKGKGKNNMPIQKKVGAQIPNGKVNSFIAKVAEKYGLNPNAFVYGPSQTTEGWKSKVAGAALAGDKKWSK